MFLMSRIRDERDAHSGEKKTHLPLCLLSGAGLEYQMVAQVYQA